MQKSAKLGIALMGAVVAVLVAIVVFSPLLLANTQPPKLEGQKEYTVNTPEPVHVPTPSKVILDERISGIKTIDFNKWQYGDTNVLLELSTKGNNNAVNAGQYKITCDATITVSDFANAYKDIAGNYHVPTKQEKVTDRTITTGWINLNGKYETTKVTFESIDSWDRVPCEAIHFKISLGAYYHGDVAVKATLLS